jgi:CheY-like chemotaxis protein/HPt (histidine-containing phosphotransfer) domain-containing protein
LTVLGDADLRELVAVFLLDAPGRLTRIERHLDALEAAAAANEAHSLSGAAGSLRLEPLATDAARLELELRGAAPDADRARALLGAVRAALAELEADAEPAGPVRVSVDTDATVLHVEDNPVNVKLVERVLARRPRVRLLTATTAAAGLRLAANERPDLVLLDLHLPDASGGEFLRRLREDRGTTDVPVVVVSADASSQSDESLAPFSVREHLTKPIDIGRLLELVDELAPTAAGAANGGRR